MLKDSPIYEAGIAKWCEVLSIQQKEVECRARHCIAGAIIVLTETLQQNSLGRLRHIKKISDRSRKFVAQVYEVQEWVSMAWIQKIIAEWNNKEKDMNKVRGIEMVWCREEWEKKQVTNMIMKIKKKFWKMKEDRIKIEKNKSKSEWRLRWVSELGTMSRMEWFGYDIKKIESREEMK